MSEHRGVSQINELPFLAYRFLLTIDGLSPMLFTEVSGLGYSLEVIEKEVSGATHSLKKMAGPIDYDEMELSRPINTSTELYDWCQQSADGVVERKDGSLDLLDETGAQIASWTFLQAWPMKYSVSDLDAGDGSVITESVTLTHEMLARAV